MTIKASDLKRAADLHGDLQQIDKFIQGVNDLNPAFHTLVIIGAMQCSVQIGDVKDGILRRRGAIATELNNLGVNTEE